MIDTIYKNHPGLDVRYLEIFKEFPELHKYVEQLEVCDRNGELTLAIWLLRSQFTIEQVVPYIFKLFDDVITPEQEETYEKLLEDTGRSDLLIVNPDMHKRILRYYYRYDFAIYGKDVSAQGAIEKTKEYNGQITKVHTVHTYADGRVKLSHAQQSSEVVGYPGCCMVISRDDGQNYYLYSTVKATQG